MNPNVRYQVAAFDLDGTLVNTQKELLPSTREAIKKLQRLGVHVVLASGRHPIGVLHVAKELGLVGTDSYIMGFNGGAILSLKRMNRIFDYQISKELAWKIADAAVEIGLSPLTYTDDELLCIDDTNEYVLHEAEINHLPVRKISSFREEVTFPVNKVLVVGDPAIISGGGEEKLQELIAEHCTVFQSAPFFLETMPIGIDKASGLQKLLDLLGLSRLELATFGDGMNDEPMIKYAALGIVMANGDERLKKSASYITKSCDEGGIAHAIDMFWRE